MKCSSVRPTTARTTLLFAVAALLSGCPDDSSPASDVGAVDAVSDLGADVASSDSVAGADATAVDPDTAADSTAADDTAVGNDTDASGGPAGPFDFGVKFPIFDIPVDALAGHGVDSCGVYQETRCEGAQAQRCEVFDSGAGAFVDEGDLDALTRRALLYDRWMALYSVPDGLVGERQFKEPPAPGTPESVWGQRENFLRYSGHGDSAIWTGTMLNGLIVRYLTTGTDADYARMEDGVRSMLRLFDVTRVPGYLARNYTLQVPPGTPLIPEHFIEARDNLDHYFREIENPEGFDWLPDIYFTGYEDLDGVVHTGTPRWRGSPTIDQMNGPMVAFPQVFNLLRDDSLRERIASHMTCYVKRLRRIEIRNLSANPELVAGLQTALSGGTASGGGDEADDEWSFEGLDTLVMYVTRQLNSKNEDTFDRSCPDEWDHTPWRVFDAGSDTFALDLFGLVQDLDAKETEREESADHFYAVNVRGADAMHMMHLALMAYAFSGDSQFLDFLRDELIGELNAPQVATTMSSYLPPRWCRKFYSTNITTAPLWAFLNLLEASPLKTHMQHVMHDAMWLKESKNLNKLDFLMMYVGALPPEIGVDHEEVKAEALATLEGFGGNGGVLDDPRRTYQRSFEDIAAALPADITLECPTEAIRARCEDGFSLFGVTLPGEEFTYECVGNDWECHLDNGTCADPLPSKALPTPLRRYGDYLWQRDPFSMTHDQWGNGNEQSPGIDLTESYWLARMYGLLPASAGQVLAWRDAEDAPEACE